MELDLTDSSTPWLLISLKDSKFAISSKIVNAIIVVPDIVETPNKHSHSRGVMHFRDTVVPIYDLRLRMGMTPTSVELQAFLDSMDQRRAEHEAWLDELARSVTEGIPFTLTTDPHQCAFGEWIDHFQTASHSLEALVRRFDKPHRAIHALAEQVKSCEVEGNTEQTHRLIEDARKGQLCRMFDLFDKVKKEYMGLKREIIVVYEDQSELYALVADAVEGIEELDAFDNNDANGGVLAHISSPLVMATAKRKETGEIVFILDYTRIQPGTSGEQKNGMSQLMLNSA